MSSERLLRVGIVGLFISLPLTSTLTVDVGFPLTIGHAFVALLAVAAIVRLRGGGRWHTWLPALLFLAFCVAYSLAFVANLGSADQAFPWATGRNAPGVRSLVKVAWLIGNIASAVIVVNAIREVRAERIAIKALVTGTVASAAYALYQVVGQSHGFFVPLLPGTEFVPGTASFWIVPRAKSTFLEPSFYGAFAAAVLPFAGGAFDGRWRRLAASGAIVAGILVTFSIAGWLSAAIGVAVLALVLPRPGWPSEMGRLVGASVTALCVVYILVPGLPRAALALVDKGSIASGSVLVLPGSSPATGTGTDPPEAAERSATERVATTQAAARMFASSPIVGVGPGNFGFRYGEFRSAGAALPDQLLIANNIYAELLAETGLLGFASYLAGFGALWLLGLRARIGAAGLRARELAAGLASMAAIATAYLTGPSFTILYQWAIVGLVTAMIVRQREEPSIS